MVESYLHGLKFNDVESLRVRRSGPTPSSSSWTRRAALGQLTQSQWYADVRRVGGEGRKGDLKIAALEVTRDIASVKVVENCPGSRHIDYLSLVRFDGAWKIVNKIYTSERR